MSKEFRIEILNNFEPMIENSIEFCRFFVSNNKIAVRTECSYLRKRKRLDRMTV